MRNFLLILCSISLSFAFEVSPNIVYQGSSFTVTSLKSANKISFLGKDYVFYPVAGKYKVILGVSYDVPVGTYSVISGAQKKLVKVIKFPFDKSVIIVPETKEEEGATNFTELAEENKVLGKVLKLQTAQRFWDGKFLRPIKKYLRISSPYGTQRVYKSEKGKVISTWAHRGVDYAAKAGTPVYAPAAGKVLVSQAMQVHGETLAIDHGQGVVSLYNHMEKRLVQKGQLVKKGQQVGRVGSTGLSTGPHLHYGLSVNNVRVNPWEWFEKGF